MNIVKSTFGPLLIAVSCISAPLLATEAKDVSDAAKVPGGTANALVPASRMLGREVVDMAGETFGEIEDYVVHADGQAFAVIGMGGFLGMAERDVLVSHKALAVSPVASDLVVYLGEAADLAHAPVYEPAFDPLRRAARQREAMIEIREEREDVAEATRQLRAALAQLERERDDLMAAQRAAREQDADTSVPKQ